MISRPMSVIPLIQSQGFLDLRKKVIKACRQHIYGCEWIDYHTDPKLVLGTTIGDIGRGNFTGAAGFIDQLIAKGNRHILHTSIETGACWFYPGDPVITHMMAGVERESISLLDAIVASTTSMRGKIFARKYTNKILMFMQLNGYFGPTNSRLARNFRNHPLIVDAEMRAAAHGAKGVQEEIHSFGTILETAPDCVRPVAVVLQRASLLRAAR